MLHLGRGHVVGRWKQRARTPTHDIRSSHGRSYTLSTCSIEGNQMASIILASSPSRASTLPGSFTNLIRSVIQLWFLRTGTVLFPSAPFSHPLPPLPCPRRRRTPTAAWNGASDRRLSNRNHRGNRSKQHQQQQQQQCTNGNAGRTREWELVDRSAPWLLSGGRARPHETKFPTCGGQIKTTCDMELFVPASSAVQVVRAVNLSCWRGGKEERDRGWEPKTRGTYRPRSRPRVWYADMFRQTLTRHATRIYRTAARFSAPFAECQREYESPDNNLKRKHGGRNAIL